MQQFGDVSGSQVWCSYCKQGICNRILSVIHFHLLKYSLLQYFCSPINWLVRYQTCYVINSLTHLGVNTRKLKLKFWALVSCSSFFFISTPNVFSAFQKQRNWPCCLNTFGGESTVYVTFQHMGKIYTFVSINLLSRVYVLYFVIPFIAIGVKMIGTPNNYCE